MVVLAGRQIEHKMSAQLSHVTAETRAKNSVNSSAYLKAPPVATSVQELDSNPRSDRATGLI